jgi:hypothetical protein
VQGQITRELLPLVLPWGEEAYMDVSEVTAYPQNCGISHGGDEMQWVLGDYVKGELKSGRVTKSGGSS